MNELAPIVAAFSIEGSPMSISSISSGHINDSYLVTTSPDHAPNYVLQRINHQIFKDIQGLMNNIAVVTQHIRGQLASKKHQYDNIQVLELIPTREGDLFYQDREGDFWRLYFHIPDSFSYDRIENPELAYEGGKAFGLFQVLTANISPEALAKTIPRFHDITWRLEQFDEAIEHDSADLVSRISDEIRFVRERTQEMHSINRLMESGRLPVRVTHNDTKFNNILFDSKDKAICIVDLDTVMPGSALFDFGDAIRTGASTADEDEPDLSKVRIDLNLFDAYSKGFLESAGSTLTKTEIDHLAFSAKFMTYIIGLRFLTDHINGDTYYKIHHPGHNLQRAKVQFTLIQSMERRWFDMLDAIKKQ